MSCSLAKMMKGNQTATVIFFVLSIILLCFQASFAQQRQSHWLIGQWNGQIEGYLPKQNPARTLQVFEVLTDGTVRGRWSITGQSTGEADVSVDGAQVRIMTGADSHVVLTRERDDLLVGAFVLKNGRGFSIRLTKSAISQTAQEAWTALEREAREAEVAGKWARASTVYRQASISARDRGQFQRAIDYGSKSLEAAAKAQAPAQEIRAILQLVHAYRRVGQANKARETLQRGIDALGEVPAGNEKIALEAQLYREMGWDLIRTGEYERATQELSRSLKSQDAQIELLGRNPKITRQAIHRFENGKSRTLELLGDAYAGAGKTEPAVKAYERGLETVKGRSLATNAVRIHLSLGQLYSRQSQYSQASENFHKALSLSENSRYSWGVLRASSQIGNLLRRTNRSTEAIPFYEKAITTIELTRAALESEEFRSGFFENMVNTYANMIRTQLEQKSLGEAFNYNERARSRAFLDILGSKIQLGRQSGLVEEEKKLQERIKQVKLRLTDSGEDDDGESDSDLNTPNRELAAAEKDYAEFLAKVRKENKEQATLMSVEPLTVNQVQKLLDPGITLLEYFVSNNDVWLWVVEKDRLQYSRVPITRSDLLSKVTAFRDAISQLEDLAKLNQQAQELYKLLIQPALPHIRGKELLIIPHDVLHYLPFQALLTPSGKYLIEDYPIHYLSSASLIQFTQEKRKIKGELTSVLAKGGTVLALGNPDLGDPKKSLRYAGIEVKEIKSLYPQSAVYLEKEATEDRAKAQVGNNDIIHFASHAELSEDDPLASAILLAKSDKEDGRLEVREIFGMDLKASLVVLSACETGLGKLSSGDELVGLTRAFIYAGTPSVVASLWNVEDSSTAQLMASLYKNLKTMTKVEALREAQLQLIRGKTNSELLARRGIGGVGKFGETPSSTLPAPGSDPSAPVVVSTSHPYFWAPFILVGEGK